MKFLFLSILIFSCFINNSFASEKFNWQHIYKYKPTHIDSSSMVSYIMSDHSLFISEFSKLYKVTLNTGKVSSLALNTDFDADPEKIKTPKAGFYYMDFIENNISFVSYTNKKGIHIWDTSVLTLLGTKYNSCGERYPYRISPDNQYLSCGSELGLFSTEKKLLKFGPRFVHNSGFSTENYFYYYARKNNHEASSIAFFDLETKKNHDLSHKDEVTYAHLSKNSNVLAVATEGGWFSKDKLYIYRLPKSHATQIDSITTEGLIVSADGQYVLASNPSGVSVYKDIAGKFTKYRQLAIGLPIDGNVTVSHEKSGYTTMIFATDSRVLFLTKTGNLELWDIEQAKLLHSMVVNKAKKVAIRFLYQTENNYVVIQWDDYDIDAYKIEVE